MVPETVYELFRRTYGGDPEVVASAPGRVNLIGEHLDYNGGEVLPMAIESRTWVAMSRVSSGSSSRVISSTEKDTGMFELPARKSGKWWDYISGLGTLPGRALPAANIAVTSEVPAGAGLSSSAALEVAAGLAYAALSGSAVDSRAVALDGWNVENEFIGVASGIMDQFASALSRRGHALHIWCDTAETEDVPFAASVMIFDTAVPRSLRSSEFNVRRAECQQALSALRKGDPSLRNLAAATIEQVETTRLPENIANRARHVVTEMQRVHAAVDSLRAKGTIDPDILYDSHASLRDLYRCSSKELDWFVDRAMSFEGVQGARLTGAGWGGCGIAFGEKEVLATAGESISRDYERVFGLKPRVWLSAAAAGARIEQAPH